MVAFWFPHHQRPQVTCVRSQGVEDRVSAQYKVSVSRLAACEGKAGEAGNSRVSKEGVGRGAQRNLRGTQWSLD